MTSSTTGSPAGGPDTVEAAIGELVEHIASDYPGHEADILAGLVLTALAHFLAEQPAADNFAATLNQRLAARDSDPVWQLAQIPRAALDDFQRAIAEGMRKAGLATRH